MPASATPTKLSHTPVSSARHTSLADARSVCRQQSVLYGCKSITTQGVSQQLRASCPPARSGMSHFHSCRRQVTTATSPRGFLMSDTLNVKSALRGKRTIGVSLTLSTHDATAAELLKVCAGTLTILGSIKPKRPICSHFPAASRRLMAVSNFLRTRKGRGAQ